MAEWRFFTNHALVLICLAEDPDMLLREIADAVGITERAAHRIIGDLENGGYISRERKGRRNYYQGHLEAGLSQPGPHHPPLQGRPMGGDAGPFLAPGRRGRGHPPGLREGPPPARERLTRP